ncbi:MAG TPA: adenylate/guanylate cyclase domain-containing protein [Solirubrobacteraceae bacterium]|nr:adenylate/guanylate cyclase domain-containing protein [Solirubrobacteraceae bacterium]
MADWLRDEPDSRHRVIDGTLVFADVSGFTRMTEMFASAGKVGAEHMAALIDLLFEHLVSGAYDYGAGVIKYGGDAVLMLFEGDGHVTRGCRAAAEMQAVIRREGRVQTTRGPVRVRMSVGVHSGTLEFLLVGARHRELIVTGPEATTITRMEAIAKPGQIVVSPATAEALARAGERRPDTPCGEGLLLRTRPKADRLPAPLLAVDYGDLDLGVAMPASLRAHILSGEIDSEHRRVTVGFVKFSGADAVLAGEGPGALTDAVERIVTAAQEAAEANQVTLLGFDIYADGAKLLMVAGAPRGLGHDEDRMLATVRSVLGCGGSLPLRAGVNSGRAFTGNSGPPYRRTYSLLGDCVNLAARLMEHAPAGEVLTTGPVIKRATGNLAITARAPFSVKGKRELVQTFSLGHSFESRAGAAGGASAVVDPIIGREAEMGVLLAAAGDAVAGRGRVVEIVGPPGIGKSRLLAELRARAGGQYLQADGDIYAAATPYAPFERLLRQRLDLGEAPHPDVIAAALEARCRERAPHLTAWLPLFGIVAGLELPSTPEIDQTDPAIRKERLEELTSEFLGAVLDEPLTLVFNDVHLMDAASAHLIARLGADAGERPWLVVITRRPGEDDGAAEAAPCTRIDLEPLGPEAAAALLAQITADVPLPPHKLAMLARRAAGNPLFLRELVAQVRAGGDPEDLPESVEDAIAARIDRLTPEHRRLMRSASVLGVLVDVPLLTEVLRDDGGGGGGGGDAAVVRELDLLDELLEPVDAVHRRFTHELVRTVAYEGLPYRRRELLHGRTADVLERIAGADTDGDHYADILSLHSFHGARFDAAWRYSRVAADRARTRYANTEAAECLQRALAAAPKVPTLDLVDLAKVDQALGDIYYELGEFRAAEVSLLRARRRAVDAPAVAATVELRIAKLRETIGKLDAALRCLARATRTIDRSGDRTAELMRGSLLARRGRIRYLQGRHADALSVANQAIEAAQNSSDLRALADALELADVAEIAMGSIDAIARTERAVAIYAELGDLGGEARGKNTLGVIAYFRGRWPEAVAHYRAAEDAYTRSGQRWAAANSACNVAEVLADQGHLEAAQAELEAAMVVLRGVEAAGEYAFGELQLGRVAARRGHTVEALERLSAARAYFTGAGESGEVILADGLIAECHALAGGHAEGLSVADHALRRAASAEGGGAYTSLLERVRGVALLGLGRREEAEVALRESLTAARAREARHDIAFALRALLGAGVSAPEAVAWRAELSGLEGQLGLVG